MTEKTVKLDLRETVEVMTVAHIGIMDQVPFGPLNFIINTGHILEDETKTDNEKFVAVKEIFLQDRETFANARFPYRHLHHATRVLIQNLLNTEELDLELPESTLETFLAVL